MIKKSMIMLLVLSAFCPAAALADTQQLVAGAAKKTEGAIAVLSFKLTTELGSRPVAGQALCINSSGLFMSVVFDPAVKPDQISEMKLTTPGLGGKSVAAKLVGVDPEMGMGFVQALGEAKWTPLEFAEKADLEIGQEVVSVGLMPAETGYVRYFGAAWVSSLLRIPEKEYYVTGGKLTSPGSPVLTADGKVVGIVHRQQQLSQEFIATDRGAIPVRTTMQYETSFFMPIDELRSIIAGAGKDRKLSWIGVVKFKPVGEDVATAMKLDRPGVMIGATVPDTPAAQAKLQERDVIISMNGQGIEVLGTPELTAQNLDRRLMRMPVGTPVQLSVFRDGNMLDVSLKTAAMPMMWFHAERYYSSAMGLGVRERVALDGYLEGSPDSKAPGVVVYFLRREGPAEGARVRTNDVMVSVAGTSVATVDAFKTVEQRILANPSLKEIELEVMRGETKETLKIKLPNR